jgi:hypothetical protein
MIVSTQNYIAEFVGIFTACQKPCGGGVEYLHREPASRKKRRNGTKKGRAIA